MTLFEENLQKQTEAKLRSNLIRPRKSEAKLRSRFIFKQAFHSFFFSRRKCISRRNTNFTLFCNFEKAFQISIFSYCVYKCLNCRMLLYSFLSWIEPFTRAISSSSACSKFTRTAPFSAKMSGSELSSQFLIYRMRNMKCLSDMTYL